MLGAVCNAIIVAMCLIVAASEFANGHYPLMLGYTGLAIAYAGFTWLYAL